MVKNGAAAKKMAVSPSRENGLLNGLLSFI